MRIFRLIKIVRVALRFGLDELILEHEPSGRLLRLTNALLFWRDISAPRAERLRLALEALGPIFVKFGQVLSTRRDLMPEDIADELEKLQDRVPPFPWEQALVELEKAYRKPVTGANGVFASFEHEPVASASVAQVHFATLPKEHGGREVAVKILRPGIAPTIAHDIALLDAMAWLLERLWSDGKRLKPREVVAEFNKHLHDELDLMREASNCSQLRRNFADSTLLMVPEVLWDWCRNSVMVMDRMAGIPIGQIDNLRAAGVDLKALSRNGVEIFFTQVFRDGFFHADMHPGNIFVATAPETFNRYIALDFGIMGTLTEVDQKYLAINFLAFFHRDYHRVAEAHIESGWAPPETRVDELEAAVRAVCEPIFDRPLKEISLLLQKTFLNVEGLGRQLDPDLDLWQTAKPYLERWMSEQVGWRGLIKHLKTEAPQWSSLLPALPRLAHQALAQAARRDIELERLRETQARTEGRLRWLGLLLAGVLVLEVVRLLV